MYPMVVMVMAVIIMGVLMVAVIPKFKEIFADAAPRRALPERARVCIRD